MKIDASLSGIRIGDALFADGVSGAAYVEVLGTPDRVVELGGPAPFGHRNNHAWFYDALGLFLSEHHLTRLISSVGVVLEPEHSYRQTKSAYSGPLDVCGVNVTRGLDAEEFVEKCQTQFHWHLGRRLFAESETVSIDIDTYRPQTPSGRKSTRKHIAVVTTAFRRAHLLTDETTS
jgi:hypothetical protein